MLASGGADTALILWDVVNEVGLFRLHGHKGPVTALLALGPGLLLSAGKDALLRVWDLATQHCVDTLVGHRGEVWALAADAGPRHVFSGAADADLRVWRVDRPARVRGRRPARGDAAIY